MMGPIDQIVFGDNQFFGINHMSQDRAQQQAERFRDLSAITDVFRAVPFYVRGNEYTRQLMHFVDNIGGAQADGHCTFRMAAETHDVIESMFEDGKNNGETQ